jgi:hypothetical protein
MVTDSLDFEGVVQFVTLVSYLQHPCVIMFFNGNHGSHCGLYFTDSYNKYRRRTVHSWGETNGRLFLHSSGILFVVKLFI